MQRTLGYGVMVTLQILVLSFLVRVRVPQQIENPIDWNSDGWISFFTLSAENSSLLSYRNRYEKDWIPTNPVFSLILIKFFLLSFYLFACMLSITSNRFLAQTASVIAITTNVTVVIIIFLSLFLIVILNNLSRVLTLQRYEMFVVCANSSTKTPSFCPFLWHKSKMQGDNNTDYWYKWAALFLLFRLFCLPLHINLPTGKISEI